MLPQERLGCAISSVAHAKQILLETLQYAKDRKAFGQQIGSLQWNKFLLAELVTKLDVAQAYIDNCIVAVTDGTLSAEDAAGAKYLATELEWSTIDRTSRT